MNNFRRNLIFISMLFANSLLIAAEFETPEQAINSYITAVSTGSGTHIKKAYSDDATIKFYDREGRYWEYSMSTFAEAVDSGKDWDAEINITALRITDNAASATVEFTWGDNQEHGYVDYLNLIKSDGYWKISGKVAQYVSSNN